MAPFRDTAERDRLPAMPTAIAKVAASPQAGHKPILRASHPNTVDPLNAPAESIVEARFRAREAKVEVSRPRVANNSDTIAKKAEAGDGKAAKNSAKVRRTGCHAQPRRSRQRKQRHRCAGPKPPRWLTAI